MCFGGVHRDFVLPLVWLHGLMDGEAYLDMLNTHVFNAGSVLRRAVEAGIEVCFMQDGAACHTHHVVLDWLCSLPVAMMGKEMTDVGGPLAPQPFPGAPRYARFPYPTRSPDMNPQEMFWGATVVELNNLPTDAIPTNEVELKAAVERAYAKCTTPA